MNFNIDVLHIQWISKNIFFDRINLRNFGTCKNMKVEIPLDFFNIKNDGFQ